MITDENNTKAYQRVVDDLNSIDEIVGEIEKEARFMVERYSRPTAVLLGWKHVMSFHARFGESSKIEYIETTVGPLRVIVSYQAKFIEVIDENPDSAFLAARYHSWSEQKKFYADKLAVAG